MNRDHTNRQTVPTQPSIGDWMERTRELIGDEAVRSIGELHVAVLGIGGVGGYACEMLARSGIGKITIVDGDIVELSNLNRQLVATMHTIDEYKVDVMKSRLQEINPGLACHAIPHFIRPENIEKVLGPNLPYDYIIDCIDMMPSKIALICKAYDCNTRIISATGAGNRLRADLVRIQDLFDTEGDPVCRIMRRELRKRGVQKHPVAYSTELPQKRGDVTSSMPFVPAAMGITLANVVLADAIGLRSWGDLF